MDGPLAKDERPERERGDMNIEIKIIFDNDKAKKYVRIKCINFDSCFFASNFYNL